jgi:1,4-alpha-glucan branching enzyme
MPLKKRYLKSKPICKVTFEVPKQAAEDATSIHLVGEFNEWDTNLTPLVRRKSGTFNVTVDLESGRDYQYRYLVDGVRWQNDSSADRYQGTHIVGVENSVVEV